ncbi:MAG: chemotaxis protein CheX [Planctomycetota bacterium]
MGEIVNMAGGNIKALLPAPSQLSLPSVAEGLDYRLSVPGARLQACVDFRSDGEPLQVIILERVDDE